MNDLKYELGDIVELKRAHPCETRSKRFEIVRVGADIKVKCLGCGNIIMFSREDFNHRLKKVIKN